MFADFLTVAALIAIFWIIVFAIYLYTSHQQRAIADEIEGVEQKLNQDTNES